MSFESSIHKGTLKSKTMYFNKLSSLPMFESGSAMNKSFYNTTYRDEYQRRNKNLKDITNNSKLMHSLNNNYESYDYRELSKKLDDKKNNRNNYFINQSENYEKKDLNRNNNSITETKYSYSDFNDEGFENPYKRPSVPTYIKRDNTYHTNAEKNITYLQAHNGQIVPSVEKKIFRRPLFRQNAVSKDDDTRERLNLVENLNNNDFETFFSERFETTPKNKTTQRSNQLIKSQDNIFNSTFNANTNDNSLSSTNNTSPREKVISFIKTSNGGLVSYVPTFKFELPNSHHSNSNANYASTSSNNLPEYEYRENWPYNNHLKIKLHNPLNQIKRNASSLSNSFS